MNYAKPLQARLQARLRHLAKAQANPMEQIIGVLGFQKVTQKIIIAARHIIGMLITCLSSYAIVTTGFAN